MDCRLLAWRGSLTTTALRTFVLTLGIVLAPAAFGECLSLVRGGIAMDVNSCAELQPEKIFDLTDPKYKWIKDLDQAGRLKLFNKYRGMLVKGSVVKSKARQVGLTTETGVLQGESHYMFVPPGQGSGCAAIRNKRVQGVVREICCEGGADAPCLLGTGYALLKVSPIGRAGTDDGDASRQRAKRSAEYKKGDLAFRKGNFKQASTMYERARADGALDIKGHYKLGLAYRKQDMCNRAVPPLEHVYNLHGRGKVWADEEDVARKAIFLLARCYSKMNDPQAATLILNGYLLEPQKFRREIVESTRHEDFGWIKTSKEFRVYIKDARAKMN